MGLGRGAGNATWRLDEGDGQHFAAGQLVVFLDLQYSVGALLTAGRHEDRAFGQVSGDEIEAGCAQVGLEKFFTVVRGAEMRVVKCRFRDVVKLEAVKLADEGRK